MVMNYSLYTQVCVLVCLVCCLSYTLLFEQQILGGWFLNWIKSQVPVAIYIIWFTTNTSNRQLFADILKILLSGLQIIVVPHVRKRIGVSWLHICNMMILTIEKTTHFTIIKHRFVVCWQERSRRMEEGKIMLMQVATCTCRYTA